MNSQHLALKALTLSLRHEARGPLATIMNELEVVANEMSKGQRQRIERSYERLLRLFCPLEMWLEQAPLAPARLSKQQKNVLVEFCSSFFDSCICFSSSSRLVWNGALKRSLSPGIFLSCFELGSLREQPICPEIAAFDVVTSLLGISFRAAFEQKCGEIIIDFGCVEGGECDDG